MGTKMTHTARAELTHVVRRRYCAAASAEKHRILDEFIAVTGYHEKSAIRVLNTEPTAKRRQIRNRPSLYDEAARAALIVLWEASDRVCGRRLRALLPILLPCAPQLIGAAADPSISETVCDSCAMMPLCWASLRS
ncbi:MAG: hypothetical protein JWO52_4579 [Gammaproteobacteria bacterium]|nr:hypothetical protein [Gammaproteobacteria bacterium]